MESKPKREDLCGRALSLQLCCAAIVLCCAVRYVHAAGRWACTAVCCCTAGMLLCSGVLCGVCCTSLQCAVLHLAVLWKYQCEPPVFANKRSCSLNNGIGRSPGTALNVTNLNEWLKKVQ